MEQKDTKKKKNKKSGKPQSIIVKGTQDRFAKSLKKKIDENGSSTTSSAKAVKKKVHQQFISTFHTLQKRLAQAKINGDISLQQELQKEMDDMGGLTMYQQMSKRGEKVHKDYNTATWISQQLTDFKNNETKLKLLDVGALNFNYPQKWIDCTSIDLNSQLSSRVLKKDFFKIEEDEDETLKGPYDVICLSLVINFVGLPKLRGDMLKQCRRYVRIFFSI